MKILAIGGSRRRHGNSEWMLRTILDIPHSDDVETELLLLKDYDISYCTGCDLCKDNDGKCVLTDDMQNIYPKLLDADVIIIATPNYFKNVSALTKNFMDRTNAFVRVKPRKLENKVAIGLCVGGEELEDTRHCEEALLRFFKGHRMNITATVNARADKLGIISENHELENVLRLLGNSISMGITDDMHSHIEIPPKNDSFEIHFMK